MPKFLIQASYTTEGAKGLLEEGGSKRRAVVEELAKASGGTLEGFYFAFGHTDAFAIVDGIDNQAAAAMALRINASGAVRLITTVLMTPEDVDEACRRQVKYRAPGQAS